MIPENIEELVEKSLPRSSRFCVPRKRNELVSQVATVATMLCQAFHRRSRTFIIGSPGAEALVHSFDERLIGSAQETFRPIPALALYTNVARRLSALAAHYDLVVAIAVDNDRNDELVKALKSPKSKSCSTIGILAGPSAVLAPHVDHSVIVPGRKPNRIRERQSRILKTMVEAINKMR